MQLSGFLIVATAIIIITIYLMKKEKFINSRLLVALVGMTIALFVLVLPLYKENNIITQITFSLLYAVQVIFLNEDFELIKTIETNSIVNIIYITTIYILFLLEPLITATAVLSTLGNNFAKIKVFFNQKKNIVVFSQINNKTLNIARTQYAKEKNVILFIDKKEKKEEYRKELKQLNALIVEQKITNLNIRNKQITYYLFNEDEEKNLIDALDLLKLNKNKSTKMYVLNNTEEARIILDSTPKNGVRLELINEINRVIYKQLYYEPIYKNAIDNQISILIVGCGKVGLEFLKAVTWCGQIINHKLNINIIDKNANKIKEKINITCPELLTNYNYNFIEADMYSEKAFNELNKLKDQNINYILVSLDTEEQNLDVSITLRRYFLMQDTEKYERSPIINLWIENDNKKEQIELLKHKFETNSYNLNTFGSISEMYNYNSIVNSEIENIAIQLHCLQSDLSTYYELEYNKKSSRALAVHLKYKLYSVLKDKYIGDLEKDLNENLENILKQYSTIKNKTILQELIINEHERWNAYTRTEGFKNATLKDVQKYRFNQGNGEKHFLAKLHPALVPYEELNKIDEALKLNGRYINSDKEMINSIEKIINNI